GDLENPAGRAGADPLACVAGEVPVERAHLPVEGAGLLVPVPLELLVRLHMRPRRRGLASRRGTAHRIAHGPLLVAMQRAVIHVFRGGRAGAAWRPDAARRTASLTVLSWSRCSAP